MLRANIWGRARRLVGRRKTASQADDPRILESLSEADQAILRESRPYTMTSTERQIALLDAVQYTVDAQVPGAFAECGVWRGGSILAIIRKLQDNGIDDRDIYLYDTFEGMTEPGEADTSRFSGSALSLWHNAVSKNQKPWQWFFDEDSFNLDLVKAVVLGTGYPAERVHFVAGMVEDTIPEQAPEALALLRLDTDWYESTRHEMEHLYPLIAVGGILLIDDYGHWDGCRKAIDEYFASPDRRLPLLQRVDYTARIVVKPDTDLHA